MNQEWQEVKLFCPNCGQKAVGYKDKSGSVKIECRRCRCVMFSRRIETRKMTITVYEDKNYIPSGTTDRVAVERASQG